MPLNYCMFQISAMWRSASFAVNLQVLSAMTPYGKKSGERLKSFAFRGGKGREDKVRALIAGGWHSLCFVRPFSDLAKQI